MLENDPWAYPLTQDVPEGLAEIPVTGPLAWSVPGCVDGWVSGELAGCEADDVVACVWGDEAAVWVCVDADWQPTSTRAATSW